MSRNVHHSGQFNRLGQAAEAQASKEAAEESPTGWGIHSCVPTFPPKGARQRVRADLLLTSVRAARTSLRST